MISTSPKKEKEALNTLGADHFVVSKDEAQLSVRALLLLCSRLQTHTVLCCRHIRSTIVATLSEEIAFFGNDGYLTLIAHVRRLLPTPLTASLTQCPPSMTSPSSCPC